MLNNRTIANRQQRSNRPGTGRRSPVLALLAIVVGFVGVYLCGLWGGVAGSQVGGLDWVVMGVGGFDVFVEECVSGLGLWLDGGKSAFLVSCWCSAPLVVGAVSRCSTSLTLL